MLALGTRLFCLLEVHGSLFVVSYTSKLFVLYTFEFFVHVSSYLFTEEGEVYRVSGQCLCSDRACVRCLHSTHTSTHTSTPGYDHTLIYSNKGAIRDATRDVHRSATIGGSGVPTLVCISVDHHQFSPLDIFAFSMMNLPSLYFWLSSNASSWSQWRQQYGISRSTHSHTLHSQCTNSAYICCSNTPRTHEPLQLTW